jgi:Homing endonuclease associated repeat
MTRFEIDFLAEYTDDALLIELRRVAALLPAGEALTKGAYEQHAPRVAHTTVRRRFGGWKQALEKAGLGHLYHGQPVSRKMRTQPARRFSNDELIAEMKRVHAIVGNEWLTSDDFNAHSIASEEAVRQRFGSFRKGLQIAGIPHHPFKARQFTDEQCFENIAGVWTHYGRAPEYREMFKAPSGIQGKTYVTRWGTW